MHLHLRPRRYTKVYLVIISTLSFVATLLHPLFTAGGSRVIEVKDSRETGREEVTFSINLPTYLHVPPSKGVAFQGQPAPQVRPIRACPVNSPVAVLAPIPSMSLLDL
jgi:hypothetical protein